MRCPTGISAAAESYLRAMLTGIMTRMWWLLQRSHVGSFVFESHIAAAEVMFGNHICWATFYGSHLF